VPRAAFSRADDGTNHYVAAHLPGDNDRLTLEVFSYVPGTVSPGSSSKIYDTVQWGRVPRRIVGRPASWLGPHMYGPYRNFQRYFTISRSGGGGAVYVKKNGRGSASRFDCKITGPGSCTVDMGSSSGTSTLWISVGAAFSGSYDLSVASSNLGPLP
jgi:hypothetical protein